MGFPLSSLLGGSFGSSAISGVSSILGGALGYAYNKKLMEAQQRYNTSERLAQQEYNTSERLAAQQYNTVEREAQNAYAEQMYNTYSSPEALVRQYEDAGLNPRLAIGANSAGSVAASSGHSATVSPQSSGMLGMTPPYQDVTSFSQGFVNIASALKSLADAKKSGVETYRLQKFMDDELKGLQYQNRATELGNLISDVKLRYAAERERREIEDLIKKIALGDVQYEELQKRIDILVHEGYIKKQEADNWYNKFTHDIGLQDAQTAKIWAEEGTITKSQPLILEELQTRIDQNRARTSEIKANTELLRVNKGLLDIQLEIEKYTKDERMSFEYENWFRMKQNLSVYQDTLLEQLKLARKNNNYYEVKMIGEMLSDIAQTVVSVEQARKGVKGSRAKSSKTFKDAD